MAATTIDASAISTSTATFTVTQAVIASPIGATQATTTSHTFSGTYGVFVEVEIIVTENVVENCQNLIQLGLPLQPNPDVSGLGVVLAFVISAYVVQCWSVFAYFTGLLPPALLRSVDVRIMKANSRHVDSEWHDALQKAAIIFSDQQIITGIGILLAGYCNIGAGLSAYHWQVIVYLAWMSSNVHLTTLTLLREWLQANSVLRRWRVTGMAILMVLLTCALIPTLSGDWLFAIRNEVYAYDPSEREEGRGLGTPVICFWGSTGRGFLNLDTPFAFAILITSYVWKMGQLFDTSRFHLKKWLRSYPEWLLERAAVRVLNGDPDTAKCKIFSAPFKFKVVMMFYVPTIALYEFFESFVASLWMLTIGLAYGSVQIFQTRIEAPAHVASQESSWGFGQILPMLFLLQPAVALFEHFYASHRVSKTKKLSASIAKPVLLKIRSNRGLDGSRPSMVAPSSTTPSTLADLEPGASSCATPQKISDILKHLEPKRPSLKAKTTDLEPQIEFMYSSKFFVFLIWLMNLVVFLCALTVLLMVEGVFKLYGEIWELSLAAIAGSIFVTSVASCCASFRSKLYR